MADTMAIHPILVPKWGMSMEQGRLAGWKVNEGAAVAVGDELVDIETEKIANAVEATHAGILRRQLGNPGETYPCGATIGVIADASVPEENIAAFILANARASSQVSDEDSAAIPQMIQVKEFTLRHLSRGTKGAPLLFIHGYGGDLNNWLFLQSALSARAITYAVDLPGHGGSSKFMRGFSGLANVGNLLLDYLDELGIDRTHVVAHSMGATVALEMVGRAGNRIASLTLLAPAGFGAPVNPEFIAALVAARTRRQVTDTLEMLFWDKELVSRDMAENFLKFKRLDGAESALAEYAGWLADLRPPLGETLNRLNRPTTVIWGTDDKIVMPVRADELPRDVRLVLLKDTGHMPHLEQSAATAHVIEDVIGRVS